MSRFTAVSGRDIGPPGQLCRQSQGHSLWGCRAIRPSDLAFKPCLRSVIAVSMLYGGLPVGASRGRTQEAPQMPQINFKPCNFVAFQRIFV